MSSSIVIDFSMDAFLQTVVISDTSELKVIDGDTVTINVVSESLTLSV